MDHLGCLASHWSVPVNNKWVSQKIDEHTAVDSTASSYIYIYIYIGLHIYTYLNALQSIGITKIIKAESLSLWTPSYWWNHWRVTKGFTGRDFKLNNFCSIPCKALEFGTYEEKLEAILRTNFEQNVQNRFHTLLGTGPGSQGLKKLLHGSCVVGYVYFCCSYLFFVFFLTWWQNRHLYNP